MGSWKCCWLLLESIFYNAFCTHIVYIQKFFLQDLLMSDLFIYRFIPELKKFEQYIFSMFGKR